MDLLTAIPPALLNALVEQKNAVAAMIGRAEYAADLTAAAAALDFAATVWNATAFRYKAGDLEAMLRQRGLAICAECRDLITSNGQTKADRKATTARLENARAFLAARP